MAAKYFIRQSDGRGLELDLARLWTANFRSTSHAVALSKILDFYAKNPAGCADVFTVYPDTHVVPVGAQSLLPRRYEYEGSPISAGVLVDYVVDADHRTLGPAMMLLRHSTDAGAGKYGFVYGSPNKLAEPALKRAGARVVGSTCRFRKLQRSAPYLKRIMPDVLAYLVAAVVDPMIACLDMLRQMREFAQLTWQEVSTADASLNEIWQDHPVHLLLACRTAEVLTWRYANYGSSVPWRCWVARDAKGSPFGYVVWRQIDSVAQVSDFFCRAPELSTRALLASYCWKLRRDRSIDTVSLTFFGSGVVNGLIRAAGFWPTRDGQPIIVKAVRPEAVPPASVWYFTPFDLDAD